MRKYLFKSKGLVFLQIFFFLLWTLAQAVVPYLSKLLFDFGFGRNFQAILWLVGIFLAATLINGVSQYLAQVLTWKLSRKFVINLRTDVVRGLLRHSVTDFQKRTIGDYLSVLTNDVSALSSDWLDPVLDIINFSLTLVVYAVFLFVFVDFRIATVILIASLLAVFLPKVTAKELSCRRKQELEGMERYTSKVKDLLEGFKFVNRRTFEPMAKEHEKSLKDAEDRRYHRGIFYSFTLNLNNFVLNIINLSAFAAVAVLLFQGEITVGTGVATLGYIESFLYPIQYIVESINSIASTKGVKERVLGLAQYQSRQLKELPSAIPSLELEDVTVEYDTFRLEDISYTFQPGKKYAIIGHNGSGKSTLFKAVMKYVQLARGKICLGGRDIQEYDTEEAIMDIDQHEHMFAATYRENVSVFGAYPTETLPSVENYLQSNMTDMVRNSSNCMELSGGQKQLVQLIRLLLADHPVLLLDEPFSAIDKTNSDLLQKELLSLPGKTILVITHDLSPEHLALYDEVLILKGGRLDFAGRPEEALRRLQGEEDISDAK